MKNIYFLLVLGLLVFIFQGDPDIHDLTIQWLQKNM
ncbi:hypothetical protein VPHK406_0267 [Vibrio phage K406]